MESVVKSTDRLDMTIAVDWDHKTKLAKITRDLKTSSTSEDSRNKYSSISCVLFMLFAGFISMTVDFVSSTVLCVLKMFCLCYRKYTRHSGPIADPWVVCSIPARPLYFPKD